MSPPHIFLFSPVTLIIFAFDGICLADFLR
ncbi:Uncharacterised protein [Yersinia intermedia]|nr:Uncharacterised protein [Yersinia intermedia]